mmetsp:Transcript_25528/g.85568  ORF Transcript_25528/g.85568 Transcript_25528/m.85568 type:complete len:442 (-) Transcript_25528:1173-2498(-)
MAAVDGHEIVSEHERDDRHELHHDVDGGARGVLERVADGVADDGRLVQVRALALGLGLAVDHDGHAALLDVLLSVVPRAARVGLRDGELHARDEGAHEEALHGGDAEEGARDDGREDHEEAGGHHFLERGVGGDLDALGVVRRAVARSALEEARDLAELARHLLDHLHGRGAHRLHRERGEPVGEHRADEEHGEGHRLEHVHDGRARQLLVAGHAGDKAAKEGERHEGRGADGEALADGRGGVTGRVEGVGLVAHARGELGHLGDAARVVAHRAVHINGEARGERTEEAEGAEGHAVHAAAREGDVGDDGNDRDGDDRRLVAEGKAIDDVGGRARLARLGHLAHRGVRVGGVVLGDEADDASADEARGDAIPRLEGRGGHLADAELGGQQRDGERVGDADHERSGHAELDLEHGLHVGLLLHGGDVGGEEGGHSADDDAGG